MKASRPATTRRRARRAPSPAAAARLREGDRVRVRILDGAERLFAERGFHGTSVRDITRATDLRLAAVNYHFGSKEALFRDVILRRAEELNRDRLERLGDAPRAGAPADRTRALVLAFVGPVLSRAESDRGWRSYLTLIAQASGSRLDALRLVAPAFNPVAERFVAALAEIYPGASLAARHHAYQLLLAATLHTFADNRRLDSLTGGLLRSRDFAAAMPALVAFTTAGIRAACETDQ